MEYKGVTSILNQTEDFRDLAVVGTLLVLPNHPTVITEFGQHSFGPKADSPQSLVLASLCHLIKVGLKNSEKEILCTSLTDMKKYEYLDFQKLYHFRWN